MISREWSVGKMKFDACPVEPPGLGSGALVDLHDVAPAEPGQVVDEAVADDAGADDDDRAVAGTVAMCLSSMRDDCCVSRNAIALMRNTLK